ncbi:MAG: DUF4832 domain-containing protein [Deltaproteobacteria bacterium]|nr:DUF4832 domain-containing protein [Deltaproteobacteria bacterium]
MGARPAALATCLVATGMVAGCHGLFGYRAVPAATDGGHTELDGQPEGGALRDGAMTDGVLDGGRDGGGPRPDARDGGALGLLVTFNPRVIPVSAPELANPFRGALAWYEDASLLPSGWPVLDSYARVTWRSLEPTENAYDFSAIESALQRVAARKGKLGLRVMAACTTCATSSAVPAYLMARMPGGTTTGAGQYVPDWNDPDFLARALALIQALAARYNTDARLGWIEPGFYGNWGSWFLFSLPGPTMTTANKYAIVDAAVAAFTGPRIIMSAGDKQALDYAMALSPRIGWRNDCAGESGLDDIWKNRPSIQGRWTSAPGIAAWCGAPAGRGYFAHGLTQVKDYHLAIVSGDTEPYTAYSAKEQAELQSALKAEGYRFVLRKLTLPAALQPGKSFEVRTEWSNVNVTPAYTRWQVELLFRPAGSTTVAWDLPLGVDLEKLLPTTNAAGVDTPVAYTTTVMWPAGALPAGNYEVALLVRDPAGYYAPLAVAIEGRRSDGSYPLGNVTLR